MNFKCTKNVLLTGTMNKLKFILLKQENKSWFRSRFRYGFYIETDMQAINSPSFTSNLFLMKKKGHCQIIMIVWTFLVFRVTMFLKVINVNGWLLTETSLNTNMELYYLQKNRHNPQTLKQDKNESQVHRRQRKLFGTRISLSCFSKEW